MWALLAGTVAWASADPCLEHVSAGDRARWAGDRPAARAHYRLALGCGSPEAEAMARLRLLAFSGNLGLVVHGPRIDAALLEVSGPWGWLAWSDYHLLAPAAMGASPAEAEHTAAQAARALPGPAAARFYLATGEPVWLTRLAQAPARDGLGEALLESGGQPAPDPGTWFLGLGLSGAPGLGVGAGLVWVHPDLALRGWGAQVVAGGSTRGAWSVDGALRTPGERFALGYGHAGRAVVDVYSGEDRAAVQQSQAWLGLELGWRPGPLTLGVGGVARWDDWGEGWQRGHGPQLRVGWDAREGWGATRRGWSAGAGAEAAWLDYPHLGVDLDLRGYRGQLRGVGAARLTWASELAAGAPLLRLPSAGGAELHRGAWAGRYRAPHIGTLDLEQRWMLVGPLEGVVFGNLAWVAQDGLHPAAGLGLRLLLPPQRFNVVRLDVAVSDSGFTVTTGWGEAF